MRSLSISRSLLVGDVEPEGPLGVLACARDLLRLELRRRPGIDRPLQGARLPHRLEGGRDGVAVVHVADAGVGERREDVGVVLQ